MWLCAIHAIKDEIVGKEKMALFIVNHLIGNPSQEFVSRYRLDDPSAFADQELILHVGNLLNYRKKGGEIDFKKTCNQILIDFRKGLLGTYSFEEPPG